MLRMLSVATALTAIPMIAQAAPQISASSTVNFVGDATFTNTDIGFVNPGDLTPGSGDYLALGTCTGCVTVTSPFQYSPFFAGLLMSASNGGVSATVTTVSQILPPEQVGNDLDLTDAVSLTLTGFATTPGTLDLTVNEATGIVSGSFSATAQAFPVPEPSSLVMLGAGLIGLGAYRLLPKDRRAS